MEKDGYILLYEYLTGERFKELPPEKQAKLRNLIENELKSLTPREQKVLRLRWVGRRSLDEVGHEFYVTRERIRQIEAKALRKLRHPYRTAKLKSFVEA